MKVTIDIPENATVKEIVQAVLKATDYEGLCGDECGCDENDLMDFGECCENCQLGWKKNCIGCKHAVEGGCENDYEYCMTTQEVVDKINTALGGQDEANDL